MARIDDEPRGRGREGNRGRGRNMLGQAARRARRIARRRARRSAQSSINAGAARDKVKRISPVGGHRSAPSGDKSARRIGGTAHKIGSVTRGATKNASGRQAQGPTKKLGFQPTSRRR